MDRPPIREDLARAISRTNNMLKLIEKHIGLADVQLDDVDDQPERNSPPRSWGGQEITA